VKLSRNGLLQYLRVRLAVVVDEIATPLGVTVDALEIVHEPKDRHGIGDRSVAAEELDLSIDVVLDELVNQADVAGLRDTVVGETGLNDRSKRLDPGFDPRWSITRICRTDRFEGSGDGPTTGVADDGGHIGVGLSDRIEDVAAEDLLAVVDIPDLIADVSGSEKPSRLFDCPHPFLRDPRVRTANGDDRRLLCRSDGIEIADRKRFHVSAVSLE
jgi:hypothetical protein